MKGKAHSLLGVTFSLLVMVLGAFPALTGAQENSTEGLSRVMRRGIRYYERGEDAQAMDSFMQILTGGEPSERAMANEYLHLITQRMHTGQTAHPQGAKTFLDKALVSPSSELPVSRSPSPRALSEEPLEGEDPAPRTPRRPVANLDQWPPDPTHKASQRDEEEEEPLRAAPRSVPPAPPAVPPSAAAVPRLDKELMKKEIKAKIRMLVEEGIKGVRNVGSAQLLMTQNGDPQALGLPASALFQSGVSFRKDSTRLIESLAKMMYGLGQVQIVIMPEGAARGEAKILDMRRAMGFSSQLYALGLSPARIRVNLLESAVSIPRPLQGFKGLILLFIYNQPLSFGGDGALGSEAGLPLSLGVFPQTLRPDKEEGVVIEFSVSESANGLASWKFSLLRPSSGGERDLAPLQEAVGSRPAFHQIYWNGRRNYFGPPLPVGRYECVLTATDSKGRQRSLQRWITVREEDAAGGPPEPADALLVSRRRPAIKPKALIKRTPVSRLKRKATRRTPVRRSTSAVPTGTVPTGAVPTGAVPASVAKAPAADRRAEASGSKGGNYEIQFAKDSYQLSSEGERRVAQIAETMGYYPMENLKVTGLAHSEEQQAQALAEKRAQMVAGLLINKYQVDPKKIRVLSAVAQAPLHKVQVDFAKPDSP